MGSVLVYGVAQLHTDGVHYRESAGTGPVVLNKVARVTDAAITAITMCDFLHVPLFSPQPLLEKKSENV